MRRFKIAVDGVEYDVTVQELELDGKISTHQPMEMPRQVHDKEVSHPRAPTTTAKAPPPPAQSNAGDVVSPLAGTVIEVKVSAGQTVKNGDLLLLLEAMKMESAIVAPMDGRVQNIAVSPGQSVQEGHVLLSLTPL